MDDEAAEQFRGEDVEVERAVAVGGGAVGAGGDRFETVHADAGELGAQTAHGDGAAFTAVALDRDAGDALERLGKVLIGELGHVLGDDGVHCADRAALDIERGFQRLAEAGDDDLLLGIAVRRGDLIGCGSVLRESGLRQGQGTARDQSGLQ